MAMKAFQHDGKAQMNSSQSHRHDGKARKKKEAEKDGAVSYDQFKEFECQRYTGMKISRSHKWYYDKGEWKEKKITPDKWQISYAVTKRRAGHAPEGSGVPVGTAYHWYIVAHQNVTKLNANDYSTSLMGMKFKVAHKRANSEKWSASERAQRKRMIQFLKEMIEALEEQSSEEQKAVETQRTRASAKKPAKRAPRKSAA